MRNLKQGSMLFMILSMSLFSFISFAQTEAAARQSTPLAEQEPAGEKMAEAPVKQQENKVPTASSAPKKMIQDGSISLQTTITGNQEQPKVLYILPWQSPPAAKVDFESLDNQQKAIFGHVERDELRRELEASEEVKH